GSIGRELYVVVFEGTDEEFPYRDSDWKEYPYRGVPVDLKKMPPIIAPYQLHFDWQMWFAAMASPDEYPWTIHLVWKLLHNDPLALRLFAGNPFPDHPPRFVRATSYKYRFAPPGNPEGRVWEREKIGDWFPVVSLHDHQLSDWMELEGWLPAEQNGHWRGNFTSQRVRQICQRRRATRRASTTRLTGELVHFRRDGLRAVPFFSLL